jgi:hypothetical protein
VHGIRPGPRYCLLLEDSARAVRQVRRQDRPSNNM